MRLRVLCVSALLDLTHVDDRQGVEENGESDEGQGQCVVSVRTAVSLKNCAAEATHDIRRARGVNPLARHPVEPCPDPCQLA